MTAAVAADIDDDVDAPGASPGIAVVRAAPQATSCGSGSHAGWQTMSVVAAKAVPGLVIAAVFPVVCFLVGRRLWGLAGAIGLALAWNGGCQAVRRLRGAPLSGLLVLGLIGLVLRGLAAIALQSAQVFFIAPAVITAVTGAAYLGSGFTSAPLVARVVRDLVPAGVLDVSDPRVARLFRSASMLYGTEQLLVATVSILMVVNLSTTTYLTLHAMVSWALFGVLVAAAAPFFWREMRAVIHSGRPLLALSA